MKSLKDISWQVTEEEYRQDKALSYSTLAKYERGGFKSLKSLFESISTPSLTFGSAVDSILTGGEDEFNERFIIADYPSISDTMINIVKYLYNTFGEECNNIKDISEEDIVDATTLYNYQMNWRPTTRVKKVIEDGEDYYNLLHLCDNGRKTILNAETYNDVYNAVKSLKESNSTQFWFSKCNEGDEKLYQLKFKATFKDVDYRCMADIIYVNHKEKYIVPVDLKTSSKPEWEFYKSFIDWSYQIQARLYWRIIRKNLDQDPYFKDFELMPYRFIVVSRGSNNPLSWEFEDTITEGTLKYKDIEMRDPFEIGDELNRYLLLNPNTPFGIHTLGNNSLKTWLNK